MDHHFTLTLVAKLAKLSLDKATRPVQPNELILAVLLLRASV